LYFDRIFHVFLNAYFPGGEKVEEQHVYRKLALGRLNSTATSHSRRQNQKSHVSPATPPVMLCQPAQLTSRSINDLSKA
jgi:hypothetical protein